MSVIDNDKFYYEDLALLKLQGTGLDQKNQLD